MIASAPYPCVIGGRPATLRVMRNDGYCWGRVVFADRRRAQCDATARRDVYWLPDDVAAAALIRAAQRGSLDRAHGWLDRKPAREVCPRCDGTRTDPKDGGDCELCPEE